MKWSQLLDSVLAPFGCAIVDGEVRALVRQADGTMALPVAKSQPSGASVHTPTTDWGAKLRRQRRRRGLADVVEKITFAGGDASGQYIGRQLHNEWNLSTWWESVKLPGEPPLDGYPHVTVAFSRKVFDWKPDAGYIVVTPAQLLRFGVLGKDKAVVLFIDSPALDAIWQATRDAGATWDYPNYSPHMTLFYLGAGYDSADWRDGNHPPLPDFPLVFGPELVGPKAFDLFAAAEAPDWYVPAARN